jgi:hypothetical protein
MAKQQPNDIVLMRPKAAGQARSTSVRIANLNQLERVVRDFGFKDRSHFFQLAANALLEVHENGQQLDWPPRFATRQPI